MRIPRPSRSIPLYFGSILLCWVLILALVATVVGAAKSEAYRRTCGISVSWWDSFWVAPQVDIHQLK